MGLLMIIGVIYGVIYIRIIVMITFLSYTTVYKLKSISIYNTITLNIIITH